MFAWVVTNEVSNDRHNDRQSRLWATRGAEIRIAIGCSGHTMTLLKSSAPEWLPGRALAISSFASHASESQRNLQLPAEHCGL